MRSKLVTRSFLKIIRKNILLDILLLVAVVGVILSSLAPPQILKIIVDMNLVPRDGDGLISRAALYLGVLVLIGVFDFLKGAILTTAGQKVSCDIMRSLMKKLGRIDAQYFSSTSTGTVVSRFTNDVDAINTMFTGGIVGMVIDLLKTVGIVASIWMFSMRLGILTLLLLPVIFVLMRVMQKSMLAAQMRSRVLIARINNHIAESVSSFRMIKSFGREAYMEKTYREHLRDNYKTVEEINFFDSIFSPAVQLVRAIVIAAVVVLSADQLKLSGLTVGMVAASIELISNLFAPIETLGMELQNIQQAISGIRRVNEFSELKEEAPKDEKIRAAEVIRGGEVAIGFAGVSFSYDEDRNVLENISLTLHPREKVTFIGRTGVGKTTLFRLVMGLMKPSSGSITVNGYDVFEIPHSEKRKIFGYVDQDFSLIPGTVADQVSLGDPLIDRENIRAALEMVGLHEYVSSLENGMDTDAGGKQLFSQGQKQLLSIARAVVSNPPVLLLDEMTAGLDSITEEKIVAALQRISENHTILSISHRLKSMIESDRIVILENGRMKSAGTPEELFETDEWYRKHMSLEMLTWSGD